MDNIKETPQQLDSLKRGVLLLAGWVAAIMSLFLYPFVFGMLGVISGILATKNTKSRIGVFLVLSSIVLMGIGLAFSTQILLLARNFL